MRKRTSYAITIDGVSGVKTTLIGKTWNEVVSILSDLENDNNIIFTDANQISIRTVEDEIKLIKEATS